MNKASKIPETNKHKESMKSPENSSSHQEMHEHEEHSPAYNLPTEIEIDGRDSLGGCSKENRDFSMEKDLACWNSSVAGESCENSDTFELVQDNPKHCHVESHCELPRMTSVDRIEESCFNTLRLYQEVTNRGGFEQVTKDGRWSEVASALNLKIEAPYHPFILQQIYVYLLEQMYIRTIQQEKAGQVQATNLSKEDSTCQASSSQDLAVEKEHMQDFVAPNADDTGMDLSRNVTGRIEAKIGSGYLIRVRVGSEELSGLLYDIEECNNSWLSVISQTGKTAGSNLDPELCSDSQCQVLAKPKSKGCQKKMTTTKDPNAPRRVRGAYQIFLQEYLKKVPRKNIRERVADTWKRLSLNERLPYIEASQKEKESCKLESSPDAPQKARSAYQIFCSEHSGLLKKTKSNIMKTAAATWKSLSENERLPYIEESRKDKERYKREMASYKQEQDAHNRIKEDQSCQSESRIDDYYHVSLQTQQETEEFLVKDESATHIAEHWMKNGDLLDASQMDWDLSESLST